MRPPAVLPSLLLGLGLGGFVDGIVLHQLLGWHHMTTARTPAGTLRGLESNVVADGLFHGGTWLVVLAGTTAMLVAWRRGRPAPGWSAHAGLLLAGWGAFNLLDGLVNHHLLGLHHVRDDLGGPLSWDLAFLAVGALQVGGGLLLLRRGAPADWGA